MKKLMKSAKESVRSLEKGLRINDSVYLLSLYFIYKITHISAGRSPNISEEETRC